MREERIELIKQIEELRGSRLISYICSDRQGAEASIGEDAVRPMYDNIRSLNNPQKIDLFLYSRGGAVQVPWRIITMLREYCEELNVLIPFRAHSAATLIAMGCDNIVMGKKGELGPIDPSLDRITQGGGTVIQEQIPVEDIMAFVGFLKDKAGLGDQSAIAENIKILAEKLTPWILGSMYRTHSHIRMVARKLLSCHEDRLDDQRVNLIVEALSEKIYLHGHGIARNEAIELGLPIKKPDATIEELMWKLLEYYEDVMTMRKPIDPDAMMGEDNDEYKASVILAMIESQEITWTFRPTFVYRRIRQAPAQVTINLNLGVSLPQGLDPALVPQEVIQQLVQQIQNSVPDPPSAGD